MIPFPTYRDCAFLFCATSLFFVASQVVADEPPVAKESKNEVPAPRLDWLRYSGEAAPYLANGIKIGELAADRAIVWVRLTEVKEAKSDGVRALGNVRKKHPLDQYNGRVTGCEGEVRLVYWQVDTPEETLIEDWKLVTAETDYTRQFRLTGLKPATMYGFRVEARAPEETKISSDLESRLTTAPAADQPNKVSFTVVTGTQWEERDNQKLGFDIYKAMKATNPSFFVHTGDIIYYDKPEPYVNNIDVARFRWNRMYALPLVRDFHNQIPSYFIKDDHDTWQNDCWPTQSNRMGKFTFKQGLKVYDEQVPMSTPKHYRTFRWGKDLQIWLVDVRDYRAPNHAPDSPGKSMWGKEQVEWFKRTVKASDATFRILLSPTPMVGPDHRGKAKKSDNHVDAKWKHEGDMLRKFISEQKNMYFICGDRHWQYLSQDAATGLWEYSCGPGSDIHATKLKNDETDPRIRFYRPKGGFLGVTIERKDNTPTITLKFHGVDGEVHHKNHFPAK